MHASSCINIVCSHINIENIFISASLTDKDNNVCNAHLWDEEYNKTYPFWKETNTKPITRGSLTLENHL